MQQFEFSDIQKKLLKFVKEHKLKMGAPDKNELDKLKIQIYILYRNEGGIRDRVGYFNSDILKVIDDLSKAGLENPIKDVMVKYECKPFMMDLEFGKDGSFRIT